MFSSGPIPHTAVASLQHRNSHAHPPLCSCRRGSVANKQRADVQPEQFRAWDKRRGSQCEIPRTKHHTGCAEGMVRKCTVYNPNTTLVSSPWAGRGDFLSCNSEIHCVGPFFHLCLATRQTTGFHFRSTSFPRVFFCHRMARGTSGRGVRSCSWRQSSQELLDLFPRPLRRFGFGLQRISVLACQETSCSSCQTVSAGIPLT